MDIAAVTRAWLRFAAGDDARLEMERRVGDLARPTWVRVLGRAEREPDGTLRRCVGTVTELNDQGAQTAMLIQLVDRISDMIVVLDDSGIVRWVNKQAERFLGRPRADCVGLSVLNFIHPEDQAAAAARLTAANETATAGATSEAVPPPQNLRAHAAGGVYRDEISERAIARAGRTDEELAVLFLDLDGFKLVNDSYGPDVGDLLLGTVARRLRDTVRAGDTPARLGGDEFVILCEHPRGEAAMLELSERIIETVSQPTTIEGYDVRVGLSIAIAFSRGADKGVVELIRDADVALYRAKHQGRGRAEVYDDSAASRAS